MKKLRLWIFIFIAATVCLGIGYLVVPDEPATRTLGFFLYFYVCIEVALQISIAHKKGKKDQEDKLKKEQEAQSK